MNAVTFVEFFVEERSMEVALRELVPKIRPGLEFQIHSFEGVHDLLDKLPRRLRGYVGWIPEDWRVVVVSGRRSQAV